MPDAAWRRGPGNAGGARPRRVGGGALGIHSIAAGNTGAGPFLAGPFRRTEPRRLGRGGAGGEARIAGAVAGDSLPRRPRGAGGAAGSTDGGRPRRVSGGGWV